LTFDGFGHVKSYTTGQETVTNSDTATAVTFDMFSVTNSGFTSTIIPYAAQQSKLSFDTSASTPSQTGRLNLNGKLYTNGLTSASDISIWSGYDLVLYSDTGSTSKFSVDGATGNTSTAGTLTVNGTTTLNGNTTVNKASNFQVFDNSGTPVKKFEVLGASGATTIGSDTNGTLTVNGAATLSSTLTVVSTSTFKNNVSIWSGYDLLLYSDTGSTLKFSVDGANGNTTTYGTFTVSGTGATALGGTLTVTGVSTFNNNIKIQSGYDLILYSDAGTTTKFSIDGATGNVDGEGTLDIAGATTLQNTLSVGSTSTFTGLITATGGLITPASVTVKSPTKTNKYTWQYNDATDSLDLVYATA
jgi:hypothetical protein